MNSQPNTYITPASTPRSPSLIAGLAPPVRMMTVRQLAETGILPEYAIRMLLKQNKLPAIYSGRKALINYDRVVEMLQNLPTGA